MLSFVLICPRPVPLLGRYRLPDFPHAVLSTSVIAGRWRSDDSRVATVAGQACAYLCASWYPDKCVFLPQVFSFAPLLSYLLEGGRWLAVFSWDAADWAWLVYEGAGVGFGHALLRSSLDSCQRMRKPSHRVYGESTLTRLHVLTGKHGMHVVKRSRLLCEAVTRSIAAPAVILQGGLGAIELDTADAQVYVVAKFTQQLIIRHSGPGLYAMFIAVRVVAAIAGSWLVLGEGVGTWLEAAGCVVVTGSMTWYLWLQYMHESRQEARGNAVAV